MPDYYDQKKGVAVDAAKESCDYETWLNSAPGDHFCCRHPHGFYVFLSPGEMGASDEYRGGDPYGMARNIGGAFQQRRIRSTLQLIKKFGTERSLGTARSLRVLDVGCGQGHITDRIKREFPDYDVHGLDHALSAIDYAHAGFKDVDFIVADAYLPPFADAYFDVLVINNMWEHVPDPLRLLASVSRVLKAGGALIISTPSRYRSVNLFRVCRGKSVKFVSKTHVTEYTVGQIKEQLHYGGYEVDTVFSPPIRSRSIAVRSLSALASLFIRLVRSHHILETTVFYLAVKLPAPAPVSGRSACESPDA